MTDNGNWTVEIKFHGRTHSFVGRMPAEKRKVALDFPRKLSVGTKVKLSAVPHRGFFCKFFAKKCEDMKLYMKKNECALCEQFTANTSTFTLFLIAPVTLKKLKCLDRLRKSGVPSKSIDSLCNDKEGVVIGFIVTEVNTELERKALERQRTKEELEKAAKTMAETFNDPMIEFDLLLDQLDTTPSAIQLCSQFMIKHENLHDSLRQKLCDTMDKYESAKARSNVIFVVHDAVKIVRSALPPDERNAKMRQSDLVVSLEKVLYRLVKALPRECRHNESIKSVFSYWVKWGLQFSRPVEDDSRRDDAFNHVDESFYALEETTSSLQSDSPSSPVKPQVSPEVQTFMKTHKINPGPWEVYLERASAQEMEELDTAAGLNAYYLSVNRDEKPKTSGRRTGEYFLYQYVKKYMPLLLDATPSRGQQKRRRAKESIDILRDALTCTWDLGDVASQSLHEVDKPVIDDVWRKIETEAINNVSGFVFGNVRRAKTNKLAKSPEVEAILRDAADDSRVNQVSLVSDLVRVFKLDSMAKEALEKVGCKKELCRLAIDLCERIRSRNAPNPSVCVVRMCQQANAAYAPKRAYSTGMKSMMAKQLQLSSFNTTETQKKRKVDGSTSITDAESPDAQYAELTDAELAALKRQIPKPPKLLFKQVDLGTIEKTETNDNGTVGVAKSGIPDAGRGLFNLSDHAWPAFSVVCIFGVRRLSKEAHHDGLNKVARCGELGETFVVVNGVVRKVDKFQTQYGHRLQPFDGLVDAEGSVGGFPNDRVYEFKEDVYWDASAFYNNCILVPGCVLENPNDTTSDIYLDQLYIVTWKEVPVREEFFLAYGTSYYEDTDKPSRGSGKQKA